MSDIELVIKIPEEEYRWIKKSDKNIFADVANKECMLHAIKNATPLPKGHGRLGDLDALEEYFKGVRKQLKASDYKNGTEFFVRDEMLLNFQQFIHLCDAIIEGSESE